MGWDASRKVPWRRIITEWVVYLAIISVVFAVFFKDSVDTGTYIGLAISGPLYVGFSAVLAKFGYQRQKLIRAQPRQTNISATKSSQIRSKPAPTSRTGGKSSKKRRK